MASVENARKFLRVGSAGLTQVRWSRYGPAYMEPVVSKEYYRRPPEEMSQEEKLEQELKKVRPIKAAPSNLSSSVFSDPMISKFINMMMKGGDKVLARSLMTQKDQKRKSRYFNMTMEEIKRKQLEKYHKAPEEERAIIECNPYTIFHKALKNCQPIIGLTSIQRGGKSYQVPVPLQDSRRRFLAMKWLITECRENKHRRVLMHQKLSQELLDAFSDQGNVVKKKHELHKMAEANRAFAHYRWW